MTDGQPVEKSTAAGATSPVHRLTSITANVLALFIILAPILWTLDPFGLSSRYLVVDQFLAAELGASLALVFLVQARQSRRTPRLVFAAMAVAALVAGVWLNHYFSNADPLFLRPDPILVMVSAALVVLCLVACWKSTGADMAITMIVFLVFGYVAQFLPSWIGSGAVRLESYVTYMVFGSDGVLGQALRILATSVVVFMIFGMMFELAGGARAIAGLALMIARHGRGAAIKVCIVASGLFGTITGSATANVTTSGSFSIPGMRKMGVPPATAGGIEAVASTVGQIMPPVMGASAFLMSDLTGIPYGQIALAATIPSLICFAVLFLNADRLAQKIEVEHGRVGDVFDDREFRLDRSSWIHVVPVVGLVWAMIAFPLRPDLAGVIGIVLALGVAFVTRGISGTWRALLAFVPQSGRRLADIVVAGSAIGIILAVIASTGLDVHITLAISQLGQQSLIVSLLATAVAAFVLGLSVSTAGVYIITGSLLAPGLVALGVPVIAAHLFVLFSAMLSMITPPVAFATLAAAGMTGASFNDTTNEAMKFGWILFLVPFLIALAPELALVGEPIVVAATLFTTTAGILVVGTAVYDPTALKPNAPRGWTVFALGIVLILPIVPQPYRLGLAVLALGYVTARGLLLRRRKIA